jgi:ATP-binding cassette subfamily B multidrug efflux pump
MFHRFERLLKPTSRPPDGPPPSQLVAFYWHYAKQARGFLAAFIIIGVAVALFDIAIPVFIGRVVTLVTQTAPQNLLAVHWRELAAMAVTLILVRPGIYLTQNLLRNQILTPGLTNLTRWQNHWHVIRQSWSFFQNDFAGRIAGRIVQTGASLRESVVSSSAVIWTVLVYGTSAVLLLGVSNIGLAAPLLVWFFCFAALLRFFVPRMRDRSRLNSEARSALTGRVVDCYSNILTVKLFARAQDEDNFVREAIDAHTDAFHRQQRLNTLFGLFLSLLNGFLIVAIGAVSIALWQSGLIAAGVVATALPLAFQINGLSWLVAENVTTIFEAIGSVQDGMRSIAIPQEMPDKADAAQLQISKGAISIENVSFGYGGSKNVLRDLTLAIRGGERVGLVGHSGAGKSTLVNLLLHFYDVDSGVIRIDGQNIADVTQESLRGHIAMVTQDTSLLHRSIRDNIRYGRPRASEAEIREAAARAHALDFIERLEDAQGRRGFDALVGERGVKLSGGQRQRIAIARVILKNAPILILDEATSALDSEVESAIQDQLGELMEGRTVVAIAHRLSTIAQMDRLVVLDRGKIVEEGPHAALLSAGGAYARSWRRQSGGFVGAPGTPAETAPA